MQIFDFSERKQSNQAATLVPARRFGGSANAEVLVTRVGDALQEPFWPEVRAARPRRTWPFRLGPCRPCTHLFASLHSPLASLHSPLASRIALADPFTHAKHCSPPPTTHTHMHTHTHTRTHTHTYIYMP